ncbi:MAG: hypothetical protein V4472_26590 [Pseudomonadota bacterium]
MDLNYLLHREQISLMRAERAACGSSRASHRGLARAYAALLDAEPYPFRNAPVLAD